MVLVQEAWCEVGDGWMVALLEVDDDVFERLPLRQTQCDTGLGRLPFRLSKRLVELSQIDAVETGSHRNASPSSIVTTIGNVFSSHELFDLTVDFV